MSTTMYRYIEIKRNENSPWELFKWYVPYEKNRNKHSRFNEETKTWEDYYKDPDVEVGDIKLQKVCYWDTGASFGGDFVSGRWSEYDCPWSNRGIPKNCSEELSKALEDNYGTTYCTLEELWNTYSTIQKKWSNSLTEAFNEKNEFGNSLKLDKIIDYIKTKEFKDELPPSDDENTLDESYYKERIDYLLEEGYDEIDMMYSDYKIADAIAREVVGFNDNNIRIIYTFG